MSAVKRYALGAVFATILLGLACVTVAAALGILVFLGRLVGAGSAVAIVGGVAIWVTLAIGISGALRDREP